MPRVKEWQPNTSGIDPFADEEPIKVKKPGVFDFIADVCQNKSREKFQVHASSYNQFIMNMALSMSPSTITHAVVLNEYPFMSKEDHFEYLMAAIPKQRLQSKWAKKNKELDEKMGILQNALGLSKKRAEEIVRKGVLTEKQYIALEQSTYKGGMAKTARKKAKND